METRTSTSLWVAGGARRKIILAVLGGVVMISRSAFHFSSAPVKAIVAAARAGMEGPAPAPVAPAAPIVEMDPATLAEFQPSLFPSLVGNAKIVPVTPADEDQRGGIVLTSSTIGLSLLSVANTSQTSAGTPFVLTPIDAGVAKAPASHSSTASAVPEPMMASVLGLGALWMLSRRRGLR